MFPGGGANGFTELISVLTKAILKLIRLSYHRHINNDLWSSTAGNNGCRLVANKLRLRKSMLLRMHGLRQLRYRLQ